MTYPEAIVVLATGDVLDAAAAFQEAGCTTWVGRARGSSGYLSADAPHGLGPVARLDERRSGSRFFFASSGFLFSLHTLILGVVKFHCSAAKQMPSIAQHMRRQPQAVISLGRTH